MAFKEHTLNSESVEGTLETRKDPLLSPNESLGLMRAGVNDDNHFADRKFFLTYQHLETAPAASSTMQYQLRCFSQTEAGGQQQAGKPMDEHK